MFSNFDIEIRVKKTHILNFENFMGDPLLINFGCLEKFLLSQAKNAFQSKFGASVIDRSRKND